MLLVRDLLNLFASFRNQRQYSLVRLAQQTLQTQQHCANVVDRTPLILQNIQTDSAREVDVRVIDRCLEQHSGRRVWVVVGELHRQLEDEAGVGCVGRAVDSRRPECDVGVGGKCGDAWRGLHHDVHEFLLESGGNQWVGVKVVRGQGVKGLSMKV